MVRGAKVCLRNQESSAWFPHRGQGCRSQGRWANPSEAFGPYPGDSGEPLMVLEQRRDPELRFLFYF